MPDANLKGKVAVVTGSSSGIGAGIALELARRGCKVAINYPFAKYKNEAQATVSEIKEVVPGAEIIMVEADIGSLDGPEKLIAETVRVFGKINILVNNAALAVNKPLSDHNLDDWDLLVNLNGRGVFLTTQAVLPHIAQGSRIINICSASSRGPPPNQTIYAGTKGMVDSFTKVWAKELPRKYGCTVNIISPGPTETAGFLSAGEEAMKTLQPIIDTIPVDSRMGKVEEVAYAVASLADDRASWINGVHLHVNGGLHID